MPGGRPLGPQRQPAAATSVAGDRNAIPAGGGGCRGRACAVRDRELSNAQEAGMEAGWLIHELAQRTRYRHFPPLVATCTNEDKGECSAILRTGELLARVLSTCCSGSGTTRARASAPASSTTTSTVTAPAVRLRYARAPGTAAGMTGRASPVDQLVDPQRTLTRLDEISQAIYAAGRNAVGISVQDPMCTSCSSKPTGGSCGPRPAATLFWGDAWLQRCHDDLDRATDFLDQAVARIT
jgi:4-alpha-glucanotransferase